MKAIGFGAVAALAILVVTPRGAAAQEANWWEWALREVVEAQDTRSRLPRLPDRDRDREDTRSDDREEARRRGPTGGERARGGGPPFCRNGQGHPVHGPRWCRDKGFGTGSASPVRWEDRGWEDIILGTPRGGERRRDSVDRGGLIDILGDVVYGRLVGENRRLGGSEPLSGRWYRPGGSASVLQIRSGSLPVAELTDLDGDGRVDAVLVPRR